MVSVIALMSEVSVVMAVVSVKSDAGLQRCVWDFGNYSDTVDVSVW